MRRHQAFALAPVDSPTDWYQGAPILGVGASSRRRVGGWREKERDSSALLRRHRAFAQPPVGRRLGLRGAEGRGGEGRGGEGRGGEGRGSIDRFIAGRQEVVAP
jgi:hypothetical protein